MRTGGSNYAWTNGTLDNPVIGTLHLHREKIESDLREMFEHGQRKISLVLWFGPLTLPSDKDDIRRHVVNSKGGVLCPQHRENLVELLGLVEEIGYNRIHFRFGGQGQAANADWTEWNKNQFDENVAFVEFVRSVVVANTTVPLVFDLAIEHANASVATTELRSLYVKRAWRRYVKAHGALDSCGFSIIGAKGLRAMLEVFSRDGQPFPACYCIDAYDDPYRALVGCAAVLREFHEIEKPVYIQETYYNDASSYAQIKRAIADAPDLNFQCVFQWGRSRGKDEPEDFPKRFDNFLVDV